MSVPNVSVVVAFSSSDVEAQPRTIVEQVGRALAAVGHSFEFVYVLDGPQPRIEQELRELDAGCPVHIVQLQGGGLGESTALSAGVARASGATRCAGACCATSRWARPSTCRPRGA